MALKRNYAEISLEELREIRRHEDKANKNRRWLSKGMKRTTLEEEKEGKSQKDKLII
jgi:hypothetical protein